MRKVVAERASGPKGAVLDVGLGGQHARWVAYPHLCLGGNDVGDERARYPRGNGEAHGAAFWGSTDVVFVKRRLSVGWLTPAAFATSLAVTRGRALFQFTFPRAF